jgi:type III secretion system low calcium response chaperone LcrH/SycD
MVTTQEAIDKMLETSIDQISPDRQVYIKQVLTKLVDNNAFVKEAFGISDQMMETCYANAYNLFKAGKYQEAIKFFDALREIDFKNPRYSLALGACYHYLKDYDAAAGNYYICKEIDVFNPIPCFYLYDCLLKLNQPLFAVNALSEVIARCGDDPAYQSIKEKALLEQDNLKQQLKTWMEQTNYHPA